MSVEPPYEPARTKRLVVRGLVAAIAVVVALNVVGYGLDRASGSNRGPASSSYTTSPRGLAAYADLLARFGHPLARLRSDLADTPPDPQSTVILLDPGPLGPTDDRVLLSFVERGGRLVIGGSSATAWLEKIVADAPRWSASGPASASVAAPTPEVAGITNVETSQEGSWSDPASGLPILISSDDVVATVETIGDGRVVMLADTSILHNNLLASADNAAFGVQVAGERSRPVLFVESVHGYASNGGLSVIPERWLWTLTGLLIATVVYMVARGRRLGPPEEQARPLPPPRRDYVEALGGILARTRETTVIGAKLRRTIHRQIAARLHLTADAAPEEVGQAASALGLDKEEVEAIARTETNENDLVFLGAALAKLHTKQGDRSERIGERV